MREQENGNRGRDMSKSTPQVKSVRKSLGNLYPETVFKSLKVHKNNKCFGSDFEFCTI